MDNLYISVCSLMVLLAINSCQGKILIIPEKTKLLVLDGDMLQLTCVYEHSGGSVDLTFYKGGQVISSNNNDGYDVSIQTSQVIANNVRDSKTLTKNATSMTDTAVFECKADAATTTSVNVTIFSVAVMHGELPEDKKTDTSVTVGCEASGVPADVAKTITWEKGGQQLQNGTKYNILENGTLVINKAERKDMGEYKCTFVFFPNDDAEKHSVTPQSPVVYAGPAIASHDNSKNMVQGDDLELKCEATGYPLPSVTWFKDGIEMNSTTRIHFLDYKGTKGKLKIFSLEDSDEAYYKCYATNDRRPYNASAEMRVRVKDKLAALWPFLGIVAEVVVLCVIILVYEKRRSKKLAEEEDTVDANQENTQDHKDVRHRRT